MGAPSKGLIAGGVLAAIAFLLNAIGMGTEDWTTTETTVRSRVFTSTYGPFTINCGNGSCPSELDGVKAMTILGALLVAAGIILVVVHIVLGAMGKPLTQKIPMIGGGLCIAAGIFILIGIIIWATSDILYPENGELGYSFILSTVGGIFSLISGAIILLTAKGG